MTDWQVRNDDGVYTICDNEDEERGRFRDADIMAAHLAWVMEQNERIGDLLAMYRERFDAAEIKNNRLNSILSHVRAADVLQAEADWEREKDGGDN